MKSFLKTSMELLGKINIHKLDHKVLCAKLNQNKQKPLHDFVLSFKKM